MGISLHKLRKWTNMMRGNSVYHVNQDEGKCYSKESVKGYYNNLTEKVSRFGNDDDSVPSTIVDSGETIYFPIAIFQYGLGAYDLYLVSKENSMKDKMLSCADWAVNNQQSNGSWVTFSFENSEHPYSSMAQGEGISLLVRAHLETRDQKYLDAARKAVEFMFIPLVEGGTSLYQDGDVFFYEYTYEPLILNGWIFSLWGIYDYVKYTNDESAQKVLSASLESLKKTLPKYDTKYWSKYDMEKRICSPFYHNLHIAQLNVMYDLFGDEIYKEYADKWTKYQNSFWKPKIAFVKKVVEKILE